MTWIGNSPNRSTNCVSNLFNSYSVWGGEEETPPVYGKVFITPPWREIYKVDQERWETFEHVEEVHSDLMAAYRHFGYEPIEIPFGSVEERISFIEQTLDLSALR